MNNNRLPEDDALAVIDLHATLDWLATPPATEAEDDLAPLHTHLAALRETPAATAQRQRVLDLLYARTIATVRRLLPELSGVALPLSRRVRHTVRGMQTLLLMLAEDYRRPPEGDRVIAPPAKAELALWRALDALAYHLLISNYAGAPYSPGIWKMTHQIYRAAMTGQCATTHIRDAEGTIEDAYLRACLLACAQPASFTSREISLVVDYIQRFSGRATILPHSRAQTAEGVFWIDAGRDTPPTSASRRPPPEGALCFACEQLAQLAEEQVDALEAGAGVSELDLPQAAITPAGHSVLRRLAHHWGHPGKRRFPRRRQNYRAELCIGLTPLWQLFQHAAEAASEVTNWMVTNESPDGYAVMHASGKTGRLTAGDVVAIRTEHKANWQVCIVRWALSENPEHLELGLQILATRATPGHLVIADAGGDGDRQPVLVLPALPPVRPDETLIAATGTTAAGAKKMILLVERENLEIREIVAKRLEEQTANIEVVAFETDPAA